MPKVAKQLSALEVKARAKQPGRHSVGGVPGLCLRVTNAQSAQWVLRTMYGGKIHDIGLGGYPLIDLHTAREDARKLYSQIRNGIDVLAEREQVRAVHVEQRQTEARNRVTFEQEARALHAIRSDEFKNAKHTQQWINTLETYAFPLLGSMVVNSIERRHVVKVLEPIWKTKTETATRVRERIEKVLDYSHAKGHRSADNPARWKGGLDSLLPKPRKLKKVKHHASLPWKQLPAFMAELRKREGMAAKALELAVLTAARSGEVRLATWAEFDLDAACWVIPAERMKAGKAHTVPLSNSAVTLLRELPRNCTCKHTPRERIHNELCPEHARDAAGKHVGIVFPGENGKPLSDMSLSAVCKRMEVEAVPHGFRSTFKDYCREVLGTKYADEVSELALAHVNSDATRAAYARSELLEQRRELMADWADYLK